MPTSSKRRADAALQESPRSSKRLRSIKSKVEEDPQEEAAPPSPSKIKRTKAVAKIELGAGKTVIVEAEQEQPGLTTKGNKSSTKKKFVAKAEVAVIDPKSDELEAATATKGESHSKSKRKPKGSASTVEMSPIAPRTQSLRMFVGAHVSAAGGVQNSIPNARHIGANSLALFLKSQRKWANPPLSDEHRNAFRSACSTHSYSSIEHVLPHGSYLVNLAQSEPEKRKQAYESFLDDLKRCDELGIRLYNFHPGSTGGAPRKEALARIADAINVAHKETKAVVPLLENMAGGTGAGNVIGASFEDLRDVIELVDDKSRVGVCLDTCHAFAAGHDLSPAGFKDTMDEFDKIVGMGYLKALHLNDSKAPLGSGRDLHANIGTGFLGLRAFHCVMNERRFEGLPMVLETPTDEGGKEGEKKVEDKGVWAREIKLLEGLIGMDVEGEEFKRMEEELAARGAKERERVGGQVGRKAAKDIKGKGKGKGKGKWSGGKASRASENEDDDSEGS